MLKQIEPLAYSKHQALKLGKTTSFAFAGETAAVKLSSSEFRHASRYYPIVFLKEAPFVPQALLSLTSGKNNFVDGEGNWKVPYIPAYFRLYPFVLGKVQDPEEKGKEKFAMCLDPEAAHFKSDEGEPLFMSDGKPTDLTQNILKSLETYEKELRATRALFKALYDQELIVDRSFKYRINKEEKRIDGFKGVDLEKLKALDDKQLAGMVKNDTMGLVYEHTQSLVNFSKFLAPRASDPGKK